MATKGGRIDFMFLAPPPPPRPATGSATGMNVITRGNSVAVNLVFECPLIITSNYRKTGVKGGE